MLYSGLMVPKRVEAVEVVRRMLVVLETLGFPRGFGGLTNSGNRVVASAVAMDQIQYLYQLLPSDTLRATNNGKPFPRRPIAK